MHVHEELYRNLERWLQFYSNEETLKVIKDLNLSDEYVLDYCKDNCELTKESIIFYRKMRVDFI